MTDDEGEQEEQDDDEVLEESDSDWGTGSDLVVISALSTSPLDCRYSEISLLDISERKPAKRNETVSLIAKLKASAKANVKLVGEPAFFS